MARNENPPRMTKCFDPVMRGYLPTLRSLVATIETILCIFDLVAMHNLEVHVSYNVHKIITGTRIMHLPNTRLLTFHLPCRMSLYTGTPL